MKQLPADLPKELENAYITEREADVIRLLAKSKSPKQVAIELDLSINTVFGLMRRAMKRLKSNKYDLVYKVHRMGMIE